MHRGHMAPPQMLRRCALEAERKHILTQDVYRRGSATSHTLSALAEIAPSAIADGELESAGRWPLGPLKGLWMTEAEAEVSDRERLWMEAWRNTDRSICESVLATDCFVLTSARGTLMDRAQWLDGAMGPFTCHEFRWEEMRPRSVAPDVVVVHARTYQRQK